MKNLQIGLELCSFMLHNRDVTNPKHMTIIPFAELTTSRQKAILAISAMRRRSDEAMQAAQADHGTQSPQFAEAAARYEQATEMLTEQTQRTRMPEHPLYVSAESAATYYDAIK